jgi:hypothetical protein
LKGQTSVERVFGPIFCRKDDTIRENNRETRKQQMADAKPDCYIG